MAPVAGWTRFKAAQDWIDRNAPAAAAAAPPGALGAHASSLSPDDQALYREFLEWKARPDETTPLIATLAHSQSLNTFVAKAARRGVTLTPPSALLSFR